jgi:UDP-glucose 4-epimerase
MKALVTGAGGFVGANLVAHLLNLGHEPVAILRPGGSGWRLEGVAAQARTEFVDLRSTEALSDLVVNVRPDVVFHLAAYGAYSWQTDLDSMIAVNVRATEALLDGARRVDARLVAAGSSSEYGFSDRATTELDRVSPNSHYAITKVAATHLCRLAATQYEQEAITLRLYSVYGPWEEPGRLMPTLVERALAGTYPRLVDPETARDFVWIDDVCDAFLRAGTTDLTDRGAVLNVASGAQTTLHALVDIVRARFDIEGDPVWGSMPARRWDTSVWVGDPSMATDMIGWTAVTPLEQGLDRLGSWMQADPVRRMRYSDSAAMHSRNSGPSASEPQAHAHRRP